MTEYCAGFMFETDRVALIRKTRPAWQAGKLNGIGGHIEPGESPLAAMVREFQEETGYWTSFTQWHPFAVLSGKDWKVHFFQTQGKLDELRTMTDEEVVVMPVTEVTTKNAIPNLSWLLPMAKSLLWDRAYQFLITEG